MNTDLEINEFSMETARLVDCFEASQCVFDESEASLKRRKSELPQLSSLNPTEKENIIQTYEALLTDLPTQCEGHRSDVAKISRELTASDEWNRRLNFSVELALFEMNRAGA
jgi:hypothetical protein